MRRLLVPAVVTGKSSHQDANGLICDDEAIGRAAQERHAVPVMFKVA